MAREMLHLTLYIILCYLTTAELRLNGIFTSYMVLQEPDESLGIHAPYLYGEALLNETVIITGSNGFPLQNVKLIPSQGPVENKTEYGNWSIAIKPNINDPSYPGPYTINISSITTSTNNQTMFTSLTDIYFGDVFLCSGQSNMQYEVHQTDTAEYEESIAINYPNIRIAQLVNHASNYPIQNISLSKNSWMIPNNVTIADFSAICWMNGRMTMDYLRNKTNKKTPRYLGLIESAIGGTSVHLWSPGYVGEACNSTGQLPNTGECAENPPGQLFNSMINPLSMNHIGISLKQIMWYQGM